MENQHIQVPDYKDYEYPLSQAYKIACAQLSGIKDIAQKCRISGLECKEMERGWEIAVSYLGQSCKITFPDIDVLSEVPVPLREKILIMHYFLKADGIPLSGKIITFRELPEGKVYLRTFAKRTTNHLVKFFGEEPELLLKTAGKLGGSRTDYGDVGVIIPAFKYVPLTFVIWKGDNEFPPEANILFDSTITDYLSTEDLIVLCEIITWKMVGFLK